MRCVRLSALGPANQTALVLWLVARQKSMFTCEAERLCEHRVLPVRKRASSAYEFPVDRSCLSGHVGRHPAAKQLVGFTGGTEGFPRRK